MKNQKQNQIRLSVKEAHDVLLRLRYERTSCVQNLAKSRELGLNSDIWEADIAVSDALIASIEAQL